MMDEETEEWLKGILRFPLSETATWHYLYGSEYNWIGFMRRQGVAEEDIEAFLRGEKFQEVGYWDESVRWIVTKTYEGSYRKVGDVWESRGYPIAELLGVVRLENFKAEDGLKEHMNLVFYADPIASGLGTLEVKLDEGVEFHEFGEFHALGGVCIKI